MKKLLFNGRVFDGKELLSDQAVLLENDKIIELLPEPVNLDDAIECWDLKGHILAPGLIDIQVNGGGGHLFNHAPNVETLARMAAAHRRFGTTGFLPTLISSDLETTKRAIEAVDQAISSGMKGILGLHLEGPYLNADSCGIHNAERFVPLDDAALRMLTAPRQGKLMLTLAPELVSAKNIRQLTESGVLVFAGHSKATYTQAKTALNSGLRGFTHLFNAMPPFLSRAPGMVGAALECNKSWFGIIADGQHVHPAAFAVAVAAKHRGGALLVTDAMATVGSKLKKFSFEGLEIEEVNGCCRTTSGALAGSALDMITAVRNATQFADIDMLEALRMASSYPAKALSLDNSLGFILPGLQASFVEVDDELKLYRTWINGEVSE